MLERTDERNEDFRKNFLSNDIAFSSTDFSLIIAQDNE
jgi:hypothetical protein